MSNATQFFSNQKEFLSYLKQGFKERDLATISLLFDRFGIHEVLRFIVPELFLNDNSNKKYIETVKYYYKYFCQEGGKLPL